jgi:hypothetical protein
MPKASLLVAMSMPCPSPCGAWCRCPHDLSRSLPPTCLFARLHASRNARVGAGGCACACAACSPELGRGLCPFRLPRTGRPRACLPHLPDSLQPFPPVSPQRGTAFGSPLPANLPSSCRRYAPVRSPKPAIQPAPALPLVAAFPLCAPAKSGALGCSTGAANKTIPSLFTQDLNL